MNSGICMCVLLAVLTLGWVGGLSTATDVSLSSSELQQTATMRQRQIREAYFTGPVQPDQGSQQRASLGTLLTRYLQKAKTGPLGAKLQKLNPSHRITDRDYMGWMDFGRRNADEYEYLS